MLQVMDPPIAEFRDTVIAAINKNANAPTYRGGYYSFYQVNQLLGIAGQRSGLIAGKRVIDFGCGATRPVTVSVLLYLLGASSTLAIDLERPFDPGAVAVAEYCNILSVISGLSLIEWAKAGVDPGFARRRAAEFDMAALLNGDLQTGLAPAVGYRISRYQDLPPDARAFDLMVSGSVFEHVADISDVMACARKSISPDGYIYTDVDFRDHRLYSQGLSQWQYLLDDGDHAPGYINKIRFTEMHALFERAGYAIVECQPVRETLPPTVEAAILPRYRAMSDVDRETVQAKFLLRPR
jgi:2-polyprenyl-3-methyl-5-hydroxy-6-metoxy-1,4-benzoquinol methylase